jgi:hypothetical protein
MANQFETSFVPQQPLLKVEAGQRPREPLNLSLIMSLIIFFVTLAVSGGAYFYKQQVDKQILVKGEELKAAEKLFDTDKISMYKDLQMKLTTAKTLVDSHTIFSLIFDLIETRAATNIGLTSLNFGQEGADMNLALTGQAPSYEAVYFQVQKWRESKPVVKSVEVTSLMLEESSGIVSFGVKISIDPKTIGYARMLAASGAKAQQQAAAVASTSESFPSPEQQIPSATSTKLNAKLSTTTAQ